MMQFLIWPLGKHCAVVSSITTVAVSVALTDSLLAKLRKVCVAGVQSLVRHSDHQVKEGGFLHRSATWAKNQVLTLSLDIKR